MKAGWKTVKLGEACKIVNGATPSTSVEANWGGPHCWITPAEMGGLSDPYVGETRRTLTDVGLADCSASLLPAGSVILSSRAPIGHVIINTVPMATNQGCKSMIPRSDLDAKFLFYFIKANVPLLESLGTGATFKELSGGKLASVEIPLPPLAEQKRIVALLDDAFAGIDEAKAKTEAVELDLEELKISLFSQQLHPSETELQPDWKLVKLDELIEFQNGYAFSSKDYSDSGHFLMRIGNVQNGQITASDPKYVQLPPDGSLNRFSLAQGDILVSLTGNVGRVGVIADAHLPAALNQRVARITLRSHAPIYREFLLHFLYSDFFREQLSDAGRGSAQQNVSTKDLIALEIALPPLAEQKQIVALMNQAFYGISDLAGHAATRMGEFSDLKQSLLAQAFAGELTT